MSTDNLLNKADIQAQLRCNLANCHASIGIFENAVLNSVDAKSCHSCMQLANADITDRLTAKCSTGMHVRWAWKSVILEHWSKSTGKPVTRNLIIISCFCSTPVSSVDICITMASLMTSCQNMWSTLWYIYIYISQLYNTEQFYFYFSDQKSSCPGIYWTTLIYCSISKLWTEKVHWSVSDMFPVALPFVT